MNVKQTVVTGALTIMAFGVFALLPANADSIDNPGPAVASFTGAPMNTAETPQYLVWDMTYGAQSPAQADANDSEGELAEEQVRDFSVG